MIVRKKYYTACFLTLCLGLSGCLNFNAKPDPSRFFLLSSIPRDDVHEIETSPGPAVGVYSVHVPEYADRLEIVTHRNSREVIVDPFHRWGEPFSDNVERVLVKNLSHMLNSQNVMMMHWENEDTHKYILGLNIIDFITDLSCERIKLVANWSLHKNESSIYTQNSTVDIPVQGDICDYNCIVRSMGVALGILSSEIAEAIDGFHTGRGG